MDEIFAYKKRDEEDYYGILGCSHSSTVEQILTEYKIKALDCHPDKHQDDPAAGEKFALLQKAKDTLVDPKKRKDYDTWKNSGLAISHGDWLSKRGTMKMSMHWAVKTQKEPMIEAKPSTITESSSNSPLISDEQWDDSRWNDWSTSDHIRKFRNYEI